MKALLRLAVFEQRLLFTKGSFIAALSAAYQDGFKEGNGLEYVEAVNALCEDLRTTLAEIERRFPPVSVEKLKHWLGELPVDKDHAARALFNLLQDEQPSEANHD